FSVSFGGESGLQKLGLGGIHPLTRRYSSGQIYCSENYSYANYV
ncbi:DUF3265 domain-containing protein, partial [Vibrio vulnificus]|nr:DUF3265 domain-containing protein [Vibrio vulnificus]EIO4061439.1 DUF3265 domain-containing protein [Vibrio vulnificus]EIU7061481.1 DUF3265 domain-containing protein [Vibrio vulnificus]ELV8759784.1 DUF3265 domain-containing protein [Vibrio vulnificus]